MTGGVTGGDTPRRLVVVGNGMAGSRLVEQVRRRDPAGRWQITVLGQERHPAYNRVLLSNLLAGTATVDSLRMSPVTADAAVDVRLGVTITGIDRERRRVHTAGEDTVAYDGLVLATGSVPLLPPITGIRDDAGELVDGVAVFRTVDDCEQILRMALGAERAVVLGGGLLGLEAARGLAGRGMAVDVVHAAPHLMERQLDAGAGSVLARTLRGLGITIHCGVTVEAADRRPDRGLRAVRLSDGRELATDLLVVSCGVRPNTRLAEQCRLQVDRGIVVDGAMRTTDPHVFAIGECAQHAGEVYGLVAPAWEQAAVLAEVLTDARTAARYTGSRLVTRLKAAGIELAAMGDVAAEVLDCADSGTEVLQFADPARGTYKKVVLRDGRIAGAILLGDPDTVGMVTRLFDRGAAAPPDRLALLFAGARAAEAQTPALLPDRTTVCRCNGVTKAAISACWLAGARTVEAIAERTHATTGCGGCRSTVEGIADWLAAANSEERSVCA